MVISAGRSPKRSLVVSVEGREVVGPGYSVPAYTLGRQWPQHVTSSRGAWQGNRVVKKEVVYPT
jgi:hypothetical protein